MLSCGHHYLTDHSTLLMVDIHSPPSPFIKEAVNPMVHWPRIFKLLSKLISISKADYRARNEFSVVAGETDVLLVKVSSQNAHNYEKMWLTIPSAFS